MGAGRLVRPRVGVRRSLVARHRQREREGRADANLAPELQLAPHQADELAADGEAKSGAAKSPGRGGVRLGERLEDGPEFVGRDANAGVRNREFQGDLLLRP